MNLQPDPDEPPPDFDCEWSPLEPTSLPQDDISPPQTVSLTSVTGRWVDTDGGDVTITQVSAGLYTAGHEMGSATV